MQRRISFQNSTFHFDDGKGGRLTRLRDREKKAAEVLINCNHKCYRELTDLSEFSWHADKEENELISAAILDETTCLTCWETAVTSLSLWVLVSR